MNPVSAVRPPVAVASVAALVAVGTAQSTPPAAADAVQELAWTILCGQAKLRQCTLRPVLDCLQDRRKRQAFAELQCLPQLWRCIAQAGEGDIRLRTQEVHIAGVTNPAAADIARLFDAARKEIRAYPKGGAVRAGLGGLMHLLIHPLLDGNGRSARMIWACALLERQFGYAGAGRMLSALLQSSAPDLITLVGIAAQGDPHPFIARWVQLLDVHQPQASGSMQTRSAEV